jgi:hypothetical protein
MNPAAPLALEEPFLGRLPINFKHFREFFARISAIPRSKISCCVCISVCRLGHFEN